MKIKIIYSFTTIFFLLLINKYLLYKDIEKQNKDIYVVNISGKQRMYSQKITKLALYYEISRDKVFANTEILKKTVELFSNSHKNLTENYLQSYNNTELESLYEDLEPYYKEIISSSNLIINSEDTSKSEDYIFNIKFNENNFLKIMDDIVYEYQNIGQNRLDQVRAREITFNIAYGLVFIYILFFIFIPFKKIKITNK